MWGRKRGAMQLLLAFLGLAGGALADTVVLVHGQKIEGKATEQGDHYLVEVAFGTLKIPKNQVREIIRETSDIERYEARRREVEELAAAALEAEKDQPGKQRAEAADACYELAAWCISEGRRLRNRRADCLARAVELVPEHALAREALGQVQYQGRWMTLDEKRRAQGLVYFRGLWMTPEAQAEMREKEKKAAAEQQLREAELARTTAEIAKLEEERQTLQAERERLEAERRRWRPVLGLPPGTYVTPDGVVVTRDGVLIGRRPSLLAPGGIIVIPQPEKEKNAGKPEKTPAPAKPAEPPETPPPPLPPPPAEAAKADPGRRSPDPKKPPDPPAQEHMPTKPHPQVDQAEKAPQPPEEK